MNTPIKREDIRKGDRILRTLTHEYTAASDGQTPLVLAAYEYELIERPVQLPTGKGVYADGNGELWRGDGLVWRRVNGRGGALLAAHIEDLALPFTLLRPVAEVAVEVLADVRVGMTARQAFLADIDKLETKWATA